MSLASVVSAACGSYLVEFIEMVEDQGGRRVGGR